MYFADLTPYQYHICPVLWDDSGPASLLPEDQFVNMADAQFEDDELNIGWLDAQHPFPIYEGPAPRWVEQLEEYVLAHLCTVTRGVHSCEFCPPGSKAPSASHEVVIGSAEIAVQGTSVVYRAPSLVAHYCRAHRYQPPEDFVNAVSRGDRSVPVPTDKRWPVRIDDFRGPVNIDVIARELREGFLASVRAPDYIRFDFRQAGDSVHVSAETFFRPRW